MFDDVIKVSKQRVSPQLYAKQTDWSEKEKLISSHGHLHKDEFRKAPKETLNQIAKPEIFDLINMALLKIIGNYII